MQMHPNDESEFKRMLGTSSFPQALLDEYAKRRRWLNRCSDGAGPMTAAMRVECVLAAGIELPALAPAPAARIDWSAVETGTPVLYTNQLGKPQPAEFVRPAELSQVDIRINGSPRIHRAKSFEVTLAPAQAEPVSAENAETVLGFNTGCGEWQEGTVKRRRSDGKLEVAFAGDEKAFRILSAEQVRVPAEA